MTNEVMARGRPGPEIDAIDLALLQGVQRDGRATYEALSRALGLSRQAVRARMVRLLESGVVQIIGVVHPSLFGLTAYAHLSVTVEGPALAVADRIAALDDARFVSVVSGSLDLVAELRSADQSALAATVRRVAAIPGVLRVDTVIYTAILKHAHFPPGPYSPTSIDDVDRRLLVHLQRDGRAAFADLGEVVGLSTSAARTRVLRLLESGAVHVGARIQPGALGPAQVVGFQLALAGHAEEAVEHIRRMSQVEYLATSIGRCDAIGTAVSHSADGVLRFLETVRAVHGVKSVASWTHLRVVKESYASSPASSSPILM
ncbi:MAG: asnC [Actinomycetia bacterium]|nr:asnC [Actinomycetes bacterium]